jgi:2-C-methyl-D-erythritol 4-phosphate cytidylyltransferase
MVYAAVLAGGVGKRMHGSDLPKQFLPLGNNSVVVRAAEHFSKHEKINNVIIPVPRDWLCYANELFERESAFGYDTGKICIIAGGGDRNASLMAAVCTIEELYGANPDDILISHDAARPFPSRRVIDENIDKCKKYGAVSTVFSLSDTPIISDDGETILEMPDRSKMYLEQTPQTFNIKLLKKVYASLGDDVKDKLTDACKMFVIKNIKVGIVTGESYNIKITTPFDYDAALAYINKGKD